MLIACTSALEAVAWSSFTGTTGLCGMTLLPKQGVVVVLHLLPDCEGPKWV
jgi:hypothetical protein